MCWYCFKRDKGCKGASLDCRQCDTGAQSKCLPEPPPDDAAINVVKTRIKMKDVVLVSKEKAAAIVATTVRDLSEEGKCLMKS